MKKKIATILTAAVIGATAFTTIVSAASGDITVVSREDGSGTRGAFVELFGIEEEKDGYMVGHASNYLKVLVADTSLKEGHIYKVKVTDHRGYDLIGVVSSEEA